MCMCVSVSLSAEVHACVNSIVVLAKSCINSV